MSYRTIVVHVDQSRHAEARIALAASVAASQGAHLIGAAMTGISRFIYHGATVDVARTVLAAQLDELMARANLALDRFDAIAGAVDGLSFERRLVDDDAAAGLAMQARYADVVVISQFDPDDPAARLDPELPAFVMLNSAAPVLMVPFIGAPPVVGEEVLVGWDESMPARRAIGNALPMLRCARKVSLAVFNTGDLPRLAGADIALFLARHGVNVEVLREETRIGVGSALLSLAADLGADLLVMGGYGHTRFREVLVGGATEAILSTMTIPVLMSH
ncbi:universal stress protein [Massilia sp. R2A-15]|uniref:universal stress protein n=1 Tax=Massilia sp. R2A-15 TaxID=3064278 RepID=UPI00273239BB|nr:universal stress protein [Massilia sp. R2A-15]WLI89878.1 universal stress protein [Massilia sp. R2A-15]